METENVSRIPLIGETAPPFTAKTTEGVINFPEDYKGKWVILFSHPADFTPVCTTEFMTFATMFDEFKKLKIIIAWTGLFASNVKTLIKNTPPT